jgi:hypothetical protein
MKERVKPAPALGKARNPRHSRLVGKERTMTDWKLPWAGGCRCGETRIRVTAPPMLTMACHCAGCQRMSAGAFSLSVAIPADGFEVTQGEPVPGGLSRDMHYFCPRCMSWMFTRPPGMDWFVNIRAAVLDDHLWVVPFVETFTSEGLPWARTPAPHSFEKFPEMDGWQPLIAAFATEGARP